MGRAGSQGLLPVPLELPRLSQSENICGPFERKMQLSPRKSLKVNSGLAPIAFWTMPSPSRDFGNGWSQGLYPDHF